MASHILLLALLALASSHANSFDSSPLQDFCVADTTSNVYVNGFVCKDPKLVTADDFFHSGLDKPGNITTPGGSRVLNPVSVTEMPGLNTLGISIARLDYPPKGLDTPHIHPRASEITVVLEGNLLVGFVTSFPGYRLITKVLKKGDVFVFPKALVHFQFNFGETNAVAINALNSQSPGLVPVADTIFGSRPPIPDYVLAKTYKVDKKIINYIRSHF